MSALSGLPQFLQLPKTPEGLLQAQRLFHGRGHAYPGLHHLTIDWLPPVILITLFAPEPLANIESLADYLLSQFTDCKNVQLQHRYQLSGPIAIIRGETITRLAIQEDNLHFNLSLGQSRNTGLFLDMRNGRRWVQAHSQDKRVLNLFAYTCGFSVAAVAGNAKSVLNVDMSSAALNVGRKNHRLNQQELSSVRFEKLDIFKSFSRFKRRGPFDLLICDPPTLQKGSVDIARDYPKILRRLDQFMAPDATLLLCLNAPELGREYLLEHMAELAPQYNLIHEIKPPEVYLEAEAKGLKILCFKASE
ncbi:MAG: methyltransferase domain-containing protein [Gammaproteobacteria bacterium]|jgi:23S rRNA (cytosine1962-C5)-methyltransferase|nr:methyltransferase domain-containing protein [Gammaproteobacteria bacterium]MBT5222548.1 methyltransferase domain-containing protein [Gammaproteobacteria bacterium]MBT5825306.1 methyltransferase domain-containing protein [Gammaproteobacteria bacterium]MBT5967259.1 methyltransferase domain-containing protein [Gammaproteobacteria bacterium]MBT6420923.1 methyltransferase domain-containing protein [Gammaproteobacteria bacterium]